MFLRLICCRPQIHMVENDVFITKQGRLYQWSIPELHDQEPLHNAGLRHPAKTLSHLYHPPTEPSTPLRENTSLSLSPNCLGSLCRSYI